MPNFSAENTLNAFLTAKLGQEVCEVLNLMLGLNLYVRPVANNWGQPFREIRHDMLQHSFTVVLTDPMLLTPFRLLIEVTSDYGRVGLLLEADGLPKGFRMNSPLNMNDHSQRMLKAIRNRHNPCLSHFNEHIGSIRNQATNVERICQTIAQVVAEYDALKPVAVTQ